MKASVAATGRAANGQQSIASSGAILAANTGGVQASAGGNAGFAAAATGSLPFTGFPVWPALVIGLALLGVGFTTRSYARRSVS